MKKLAIVFSYLLASIWSILPIEWNLYFGRFLAFLWIDVFRIRRTVIMENISVVFPNMTLTQKQDLAKISMTNFCRSFFDIIKIRSVTDEWIQKNVRFHGLKNYTDAKSTDKGLFFLSLHLGSGDLASSILSRKVIPIYLITKRIKNLFLDQFWFSLRGGLSTRFIDAHSKRNVFEILGAIKAGAGVIFVLDQFMGQPYGVESTFFGKTTGTAYGLSLFVKKSKVPVLPVFTFWGEDKKLHINISERIDLSPFFSDTEEQYKRNATNRFNSELEKIIRQHPEHWMWLHRRWKEFE